jgi:photosystem II stability/assembly factor-like uncharacterized protein
VVDVLEAPHIMLAVLQYAPAHTTPLLVPARVIRGRGPRRHHSGVVQMPRSAAAVAALSLALAAGLAPTAAAQSLRWTRTSGPSTGAPLADLDPFGTQGMLACSRDRVFVTTDSTEWFDITAGLEVPFGSLKQVLTHRFRQFVIRGDGVVFRGGNFGWDELPIPLPADGTNALTSTADTLILVGSPFLGLADFIFRSDDDGESWSPITIPVDEFVGNLRLVDGVLFVQRFFGGGFLRSEDLGETWTASGPDAPQFLGTGPVIVGNEWIVPDTLLTYVSTDRGVTWTTKPATGAASGLYVSDGTTILAALSEGIARSTDAGSTWTTVTTGLPRCIEGFIQDLVHQNGSFLAATPVGLFRSADAGLTWSRASVGLEQGVAFKLAAADQLHAVGRANPRVFTLADDAWSTSAVGIPPCTQPDGFFAENATVYIGSLYDGVSRSTNGGLTFAPFNSGLPIYNGTAGNQFREVSAFARHAGRLLAGTGFGTEFFNQSFTISGGGMLRLNDAGTGWTRINRGFPIMARNSFNDPVYDPVLNVNDASGPWGQLALVGSYRNGPIRTTDRGENWTRSNAGLPRDPNGFPPMINDFAVLGDAILAGAIGFPIVFDPNGIDRGVFLSRDAGLTWSRAMTNVADLAPVNAFALLEGVAYAAADRVYRSTDGDHWEVVPNSPSSGEVFDLAVFEGKLHAAVNSPAGSFVWIATPGCLADFNADGFTDFFDYDAFVACYLGEGCPAGETADANQDSFVDFFDYATFVEAFEAGC